MKPQDILNELKTKAVNDPKLSKRIALMESTMSCANHLVSDLKTIVKYDRKVPRILRKEKYSKRKSAGLKLQMLLNVEIARMQHRIILSQPVPKYQTGGVQVVN